MPTDGDIGLFAFQNIPRGTGADLVLPDPPRRRAEHLFPDLEGRPDHLLPDSEVGQRTRQRRRGRQEVLLENLALEGILQVSE